jgi:hypothetical protein
VRTRIKARQRCYTLRGSGAHGSHLGTLVMQPLGTGSWDKPARQRESLRA